MLCCLMDTEWRSWGGKGPLRAVEPMMMIMMMIKKDHAKRRWLGFFRDTNPTSKSIGWGKPRKPHPDKQCSLTKTIRSFIPREKLVVEKQRKTLSNRLVFRRLRIKSREAPIRFFAYVCSYVSPLLSLPGLREIYYWTFLLKSFNTIQISLKSDRCIG